MPNFRVVFGGAIWQICKMRKVLLNAQFYTGLLLFTALYIPLALATVAVASLFSSRRATFRRFRRAISLYGLVVVRVLPWPWIRVRSVGFDFARAPGPYVFVCNHRSASDAFLLSVLPVEGVQVANIWPFRLPVFGFFARWAGYLSVREMDPDDFFAQAGALLRDGVCLGVFPEGTRSKDGRMGPFHGTVFRLALREPCTIVPVAIVGSERRPPKGSLLLEPGEIVLRQAPPIPSASFRDWPPFRLKTHVRDVLIDAIGEEEGGRSEQ